MRCVSQMGEEWSQRPRSREGKWKWFYFSCYQLVLVYSYKDSWRDLLVIVEIQTYFQRRANVFFTSFFLGQFFKLSM